MCYNYLQINDFLFGMLPNNLFVFFHLASETPVSVACQSSSITVKSRNLGANWIHNTCYILTEHPYFVIETVE